MENKSNSPRDATREHGKIERVNVGPEDHGIPTAWVFVDFDGSGQGFGGLVLKPEKGLDTMADYLKDLCDTFAVKRPEDLVGKECYALRCFDEHNTPIEGLEAMNGRRFTHTAWRRKHWPDTKDPLEEEIDRQRSTIAWAERRFNEATHAAATARRRYRSWT